MRNVERINVKGLTVEVAELRVRDVRELMQMRQQSLDNNIVQRCISVNINKFSEDEFALINAAFMRVNAAFYKQDTGHGYNQESAGQGVAQLDMTCCVLIECGHAGVANYGWGFFLTCIKAQANVG